MQKWLDDNDILMYSTHNEAKSVVSKRFIRTLKIQIYKRMRANDSKSYHGYLNKLLNQYNNTYHCSIAKNPTDDLAEDIESSYKAPKFKFCSRVTVTKYNNIFTKGCTKN